jgi:DEAD/DEAH box helicase domain-containing protein
VEIIDHLRSQPFYKNQVVHLERLPSQEASYQKIEPPLPPVLEAALKALGVFPLYTHQATALNFARQGKNVMVVTPAASGKSLCYHLPVIEAILKDRNSRALYLFPTKALAQDQLRSLAHLVGEGLPSLNYATFDGDTPSEERARIKRQAQIVLTNPDMLHLGILPNHHSWERFFHQLKYVVVDEAHIYRGVFGSQVSNILRRLRRICQFYHSQPQFICCSATIANPKEHIEKLVGLPFEVIDKDGAGHGGKDFILWNPPFLDKAKLVRRSANSEASFLLAELVRQNIRTLVFVQTRQLTELIYNYAKERLAEPALSQRIKPYRAGYLAEERRKIERELFDGRLIGAVATNALELGIDIGDLEATVLTGYPGTIASTWQQAGRSGRGENRSLSFLIALNNPLDQYFMRHPEFLFHKGVESALTNPDNPQILKSHLLCAAWELPLTQEDSQIFRANFSSTLAELENEQLINPRGGKYYPMPQINYPAGEVNIRSASSYYFSIVDSSQGNRLLETVEASVAFSQIHPGAIYLHQGESFLIQKLDLTSHIAYAQPVDLPYYTQAKEITEIRIIQPTEERHLPRTYFGQVKVTTNVIGFRKKMQFTEEVIGEEPVDLPAYSFDTEALWFDIPAGVERKLLEGGLDFAGGLHAVEHAAIGILPLFAGCDRNDIGGVSTPFHPSTGKAQVFIYDAYPGGVGISRKGFEVIEELFQATLNAIIECPCREGCPSCIQSPKCGNNNQPLDKEAAKIILKALL